MSLGSEVATDKAKLITSAFNKSTVGFATDQYFKFCATITFNKKYGESTK